jgi:hypothetical protein
MATQNSSGFANTHSAWERVSPDDWVSAGTACQSGILINYSNIGDIALCIINCIGGLKRILSLHSADVLSLSIFTQLEAIIMDKS